MTESEGLKSERPMRFRTQIEVFAERFATRLISYSQGLSASPLRWFLAPALVAVVCSLRAWLQPLLKTAPFLLHIVPIFLTALTLGFWQGLYATLLAGTAVEFLFIEPVYTWTVYRPADQVQLGIFALEGIFISFFAGAFRQANRRTQEAVVFADEANRVKSEFLANMSHEIRTPLSAIVGFADFIQDSSLSEEERKKFAQIIIRNGSLLTNLINDILDLSKIEAGKLEIESAPVNTTEVLSDVVNIMRIRAEENGVDIRVETASDVPEEFCGDALRVRQILINLIGNAIKFTDSGFIRVSTGVVSNSQDGGMIIGVRVEDTGKGIPKEKRESVFLPFVQADASTSRSHGGTGLGLTLSRKLARALGGDLVLLESAPEKGSVFLATFKAIPVTPQHRMRTAPKVAGAGAATGRGGLLKGIRILLAEDSPDNQVLVRKYLSSEGALVNIVEDGARAVKEALSQTYDIVLMDIQMPIMDGYKATRKLRDEHFERPIVALTAHALTGDREKCLSEGCTEYVTKPVDRQRLIDVVKRLVRVPTTSLGGLT